MSKKSKFIEFVQTLINECNIDDLGLIDPEAREYWEAFSNEPEVEKPPLTENGKLILKYLQDNPDTKTWKAKDIGEGLLVSSRTTSGALRKLVTDNFVEKLGANPTIYTLTEKGKNFEII